MGNGKITFNEKGQVLGPSKAKPESYVEVRFSGGAKGQVKVGSITKSSVFITEVCLYLTLEEGTGD